MLMKDLRRLLSVFCFVLLALPSFAQTSIEMEEENGVYKVPCKVNGLKLKFIFDTGASSVSISSTIANMMFENGYLSEDDILGSGQTQIANGDIIDNTVINIKEIEISGMILKDVQAVVIHQQSAPLLLGQSAIQKLGKVSIVGNRLLIDQIATQNPYKETGNRLSEAEVEREMMKAREFRQNNNHLAALEIYERIVKGNYFVEFGHPYRAATTLRDYAHCLSALEKYYEAMNIYMSLEDWTEENDKDELPLLYLSICQCAYNCNEYNLAIKYGLLCQGKILVTDNQYPISVFLIASSYSQQNKKYDAQYAYKNYIAKYLYYMELSILDCWNKNFRDETLANALHSMSLMNIDDYDKYQIIAAAWGNPNAIETCSKFNLDYSSKPKQYEYKF